MSHVRSALKKIWKEGKTTIFFYSIFVLCCAFTFVAEMMQPSLLDRLALTRATPWGTVSSMLVHLTIEHLLNNMVALVIYVMLFLLAMHVNDYSGVKQVSMFFCLGPFVCAVVANGVYLALSPEAHSVGASGVVYAMEGTILMTSLSNVLTRMQSNGIRPYLTDISNLRHFCLNSVLFSHFFIRALFYPHTFLDVAPGVNAPVHAFAFLSSCFLSCFAYLRRPKGWGSQDTRGLDVIATDS